MPGRARHLLTERDGPLARRTQVLLRFVEFDRHLPELATGASSGAVRALALGTLLRGEARWPEGWTWVWLDKAYLRQVRRRAFGSRRLSPVDPRPLLAAGAGDKSPAVRRVIADAVIVLGPEALAPELLDRLRRDKTAPVAERMAFFDRKWMGRRAAPRRGDDAS